MLRIKCGKIERPIRRAFKAKTATLKLNTKTGEHELSSPVKPGDEVVSDNGYPPKDGKYNVNSNKYILTLKGGKVVEYISLKELVKRGI